MYKRCRPECPCRIFSPLRMVSLYVFNFWLAACLLEGASSIAFSNTVFDDIAIGSNWTFSWVQANGPVVLTLKQGVGTDSENAVKTIIGKSFKQIHLSRWATRAYIIGSRRRDKFSVPLVSPSHCRSEDICRRISDRDQVYGYPGIFAEI
jgi:hypothetical protein